MTDQDITKLASKLTKFLATKDDIQEVKADLGGVKDDIQEVKADLGGVKGDIKRLEKKIDELDDKADTILEFAEAVDETVTDYGKRLKRIETFSATAHQIKR